MRAGLGLGISALGARPRGPLDPRTVPELMAGAIWIPGTQDTTGGGGARTVLSQATQANPLTTSGVTGDVPALTTASNGAPVWAFGGATYTALRVVAPGSAMRWTTKGSFAGWFKGAALTGTIQALFSQWPEGADATNNRLIAGLTLGDNSRWNINGSWNGLSTDQPTNVGPDNRWKYNSSAGIDFTAWHFLRVTVDYTLDNYSTGGVNYSNRVRVFVDEVLDVGSGYSAPHDGVTPETRWGTAPDGPVRGTQLYPATSAFTLGSTHALGGSWRGYIGPFYICNGEISAAKWKRIMKFNAPA